VHPTRLRRSAVRRTALMCAGLAATADVLYIAVIYAAVAIRNMQSPVYVSWPALDAAMQLWNRVHFPVRFVVEPLLFSEATSHPPSPSGAVYFLYYALCVAEFALIGYALGASACILLMRIHRDPRPRP
jgi:hypothetical protein